MEEDSVIGNWIKQKVLGSGSFGTVSLWRNLKSDQHLAIKICKWGNDPLLTTKHKERWTNEVEMMKLIENDNIVRTELLPEDLAKGLIPTNISKLPILCMEYCSQGDLRQLLNQPTNGNGLPEIEVRNILSDMKNAVRYLHDLKITHRDLKPENIVLQPNNENHPRKTIYKLVDLGYAKEIDSQSVCGSFVGTLQYLAPELLYSKSYSNTVDYWSLGLVAFEVICGIRPFLPNMSPVQWMKHVKTKSLEQICIFENFSGEVEFSTHLFDENHISGSFKNLIEKWLRIALHWDPKRRGRVVEDKCVQFTLPTDSEDGPAPSVPARESPLVIFSLLKSVLSKKILIVFSAATYEYLSYEIDDSTLFSSVQIWIERDTKISSNNQLFISPVHEEEMDLAHKYWDPYLIIMLFVYQRDCLFLNDNKPKPNIPSKLRPCFKDPKMKCKYNLLVEISSCALHFIRKERQLYDSLVAAYQLIVDDLIRQIKKLHLDQNNSDKLMCKLIEKTDLLRSILEFNQEFERKTQLLSYKTAFRLWSDKCNVSLDKISKLREAWSQLSTRLQSVKRRCHDVQNKEISSNVVVTNYKEVQNEACNLIIEIKNLPKEDRVNPVPCLAVAKTLLKFCKIRENSLKNCEMQKISQQIIDIHVETTKMTQLIINVGQNAVELSAELTRLILEKEQITVSLLSSNVSTFGEATQHTVPGSVELPPQSVVNFKIGAAVSNPRVKTLSTNMDELQSLIQDNVSLQNNSKVILQKSFDNHKTILSEIDFSFLK